MQPVEVDSCPKIANTTACYLLFKMFNRDLQLASNEFSRVCTQYYHLLVVVQSKHSVVVA